MGRGLSAEQWDYLKLLDTHKEKWGDVLGKRLDIAHPRQESLDGSYTEADMKRYRSATASQSRTLHRLMRRGLVKKVKTMHYYKASHHLGSVQVFQLTPSGEELLAAHNKGAAPA
jgi:hypothetical protein